MSTHAGASQTGPTFTAPTTPKQKNKFSEDVITITSSPETPKAQQSIRQFFPLTPSVRMADLPRNNGPVELTLGTTLDSSPMSRKTTSSLQEDVADITADIPRITTTFMAAESVAKESFQRRKEVIRLRDSLAGAWVAEDAATSRRKLSPERKRKRAGLNMKELRTSQVETLDLTDM